MFTMLALITSTSLLSLINTVIQCCCLVQLAARPVDYLNSVMTSKNRLCTFILDVWYYCSISFRFEVNCPFNIVEASKRASLTAVAM